MRNGTLNSPDPVVRWTFQYGSDVLTCGVDWHSGPSAYILSIVPNGHEDRAMIEICESSLTALKRHAAIAASLREHGWTLIGYSDQRAGSTKNYQPAA
jgi:hypothetical protein